MQRRTTIVVSGSFHRALAEVQAAVRAAEALGATVLSPQDPTVVDAFGDFLYVASDRLRSIRAVQSRHFAAIETADLVWLAAPEGYIGLSAAAEIGFATRCGTPVFTNCAPTDLTMRQYVHVCSGVPEAVRRVAAGGDAAPSALLDPSGAIALAHSHLETMQRLLVTPTTAQSDSAVHGHADAVKDILRYA